MKSDLHELVQRKLDWYNRIPGEIYPKRESYFKMIKEIIIIKFNRAVIPEKATSLEINTTDVADTNKRIVYTATYVRFKRRSGTYSCQLIFRRPKSVLKGMSNG